MKDKFIQPANYEPPSRPGNRNNEKTIKPEIEIMSLRQEVPIEELKTSKNQLDILTMRNPFTGAEDEMCKKYEHLARLTDTAILNYAKWKQEHNLACDLAKALLKVLALSGNEELKQKYIDLLERAKKHKCFEFTDEDYKKLWIGSEEISMLYEDELDYYFECSECGAKSSETCKCESEE